MASPYTSPSPLKLSMRIAIILPSDVDSSGCLVELIGRMAVYGASLGPSAVSSANRAVENIVALRNRHLRVSCCCRIPECRCPDQTIRRRIWSNTLCVSAGFALFILKELAFPKRHVSGRGTLPSVPRRRPANCPVIDSLGIHGRLFAVDQCIRSDIKGCDDPYWGRSRLPPLS